MRKLFRSKILVSLLAVFVAGAVLAGCGKKAQPPAAGELSGKVTAAGSTALLPLLKPAAEEFQKKYPKITVNISGGGSFTGLNQVAAGNVNIGNSDVFATGEYQDKGLVDHKICVIPFTIIVNPGVPVSSLTKQQLVDIFSGKITNWKEVGGKDEKITIMQRAKSSGSRATIQATIMKDVPFTDNAIVQDSNGAVKAAIASTPGAIGYVDAPYVDNTVKAMAIDGVPYSPENVISGKYDVYGFGHMYTKGEPTGAVKAFIDFVLSAEYQNTYVEKNGFIPISKMKK